MYSDKKLKDLLPELFESKYFLIHYGFRNPPSGKGLGIHGVRDLEVVETCAEILDAAYEKFHDGWGRPKPVCDGSGKISAYILGGLSDPLMFARDGEFPAIILPPFNQEVADKSSQQRIEAEITHEVCHVFNFSQHPTTDWLSGRWSWFDEGVSVYSESQVFEGNKDYYRFLPMWIVMPELSLDSSEVEYQASQLVRYLARRFGKRFVNEVWMGSTREESPIEAINRFLPDGLKFVSLENGEPDVFSDYCRDAYFLLDSNSHCYDQEIWTRYGDRASAESFEMQIGSHAEASSEVNHLACRYFRFSIANGIKKLDVRLEALSDSSPLKAEIAVVSSKGENLRAQRLTSPLSVPPGQTTILESEFLLPENCEIDHVVVIVTNCGLRHEQENLYLPHDDQQKFRLMVTAEG